MGLKGRKGQLNAIAARFKFNIANAKEAVVTGNYEGFKREFAAAFTAIEPERFDPKTGAVVAGGGPDWRTRMDAIKVYAAIAGLTGTQSVIIQQINATFGVRNEEELRSLVDAGRKFLESQNDVSATPERVADLALEALIMYAPRCGKLDAAIERLTMLRGRTLAQDEPSENGDG